MKSINNPSSNNIPSNNVPRVKPYMGHLTSAEIGQLASAGKLGSGEQLNQRFNSSDHSFK